MKHSHLINLSPQSFKNPHAMLSAIIIICLVTTSCRKMDISKPENARELQPSISAMNNNIILEKIILNGSVVRLRTQNNMKQMTLAAINHPDGSFKKETAYEYDPQGRLYIGVENGIYRSIYETDRFGIILKSSVSRIDSLFPRLVHNYEYNTKGNLAACKTYERSESGNNGRDILIGGSGYDYNPDGTIRSIKIYDFKVSKEPVGKVDLFNNATPMQVAAWKEIAGRFPEPEKPWDILTMLCNRIEMHGKGIIAGESLVDGKILTSKNMVFSADGYLASKDENNNQAASLSLNYTKIEYKYMPMK